jgi:hypothetical protein
MSDEKKEKKSKKINKLTAEEITKKIGELETANATHMTYYKHLLQRQKQTAK